VRNHGTEIFLVSLRCEQLSFKFKQLLTQKDAAPICKTKKARKHRKGEDPNHHTRNHNECLHISPGPPPSTSSKRNRPNHQADASETNYRMVEINKSRTKDPMQPTQKPMQPTQKNAAQPRQPKINKYTPNEYKETKAHKH
jgi:hypothetical protein